MISYEIGRYQVLKEGGRVKSAGISVDFVLQQGDLFKSQQSPATATQVAKTFHTLRDNPPSAIRDRFFPSDRTEIKALTKRSPALFRPVLKTDQGAGKFLPFTVAPDGHSLRFQVAREEGYIIPEAHFQDQLTRSPSEGVTRELELVRERFREGNLYETFLAFQRLEIESVQARYTFKRRAQVGRNALMFIHPAAPEQRITLPENVVGTVEEKVQAAIEQLTDIANRRKKEFADKCNLPFREFDEYSLPFYLQADVHLFPNGNPVVAELQVPDVGLFLAGLPENDNETFGQVKKIVNMLKKKVIEGFENVIKKAKHERGEIPVFLVTRNEVITDREDVLEVRELDEVQKGLAERGQVVQIISAEQAAEIDSESLMFVFNLDPNSEEFQKFAKSYVTDTTRKKIVSPDPFFRVAEREVTGYASVELTADNLANFHALVGEVELFDKSNKVYIQTMAVDYFLRQLGIEDDVLHFYHPTLTTPIPAYRYDIRGLHLASNAMKEQQLQEVQIRSIPISKDKGVLSDIDGGTLYATFRFMLVRS